MKKNSVLSSIRLIAFIMIIACHILQGLNNFLAFWVNLGVQIFFFLSGYLYGMKELDNYTEFYKKRIFKILIPNAILIISMLIVDKAFFNVEYSLSIILANLLGFGGFYGTLNTLSHTWFVSYILICYLITPILDIILKKSNSKRKIMVIVIMLFLLDFFHVVNVNSAWVCNYVFGFWYTRCLEEKSKTKFFLLVIFMSLITLPLKIIVTYRLIPLPNIIVNYSSYILNWTHVLLGISLFLIFYKIFSKIKPKYNKLLYFSDKYSYTIYLTHQIFILNYLSLLQFTNNLFVNIIFVLICAMLSGYLLNIVSNYVEKLLLKRIKKT